MCAPSIVLTLLLCMRLSASAVVGSLSRSPNLAMAASGDHHCTDSFQWTSTGSKLQDCIAAIEQLRDNDVRSYGDLELEFFSSKVRARSRLAMPTPIKYTHGGSSVLKPRLSIHSLRVRTHMKKRYMHACSRHAQLFH